MKINIILILSVVCLEIKSQKLPSEMTFSPDSKRLVSGSQAVEGLYNPNKIRRIDLKFDQTDYWALLTANYQSKTDIPATLIMEGDTFPNVGVRFKGQTSYQRVTGQKKSFNITMDFLDPTQDLKGYETLNFNNSFEDNSFMREVFYENITRPFSSSLKANYIHLYINNQDWGIYPNVQALDGNYVKEWFLSNEGSRWRCERTSGGGPGGGGGFGAGTSTLNYLGDDTTAYKPNYTLKHTTLENPWSDLARVTKVLNTVPLALLEDSLKKVLDIDRALWFIAKEIMFGDDDSYVNKGGMDYYAIYQKDVERLIPLEYDANSVMSGQTANWSIFLKEADTKFPLCNRLFAVPSLRQRYLAHFKTMFKECLDSTNFVTQLNKQYSFIDSLVAADPKKLMTYQAFQSEKNNLINWMRNRRNTIQANSEFKQIGCTIEAINASSNGVLNQTPDETQTVQINAKITNKTNGVKRVNLHYAPGFDGYFNVSQMFDDGLHDDGIAGDGIYGGTIPPFPNGVFVRYYIEAIANNTQGTCSYMPEGAEHDVYIYQVNLIQSSSNQIVLNEIMASNTKTVADQDGEYDDWIELFNKSNDTVDISNWILTDNSTNLDKFRFPAGTKILPQSYLIIWADEDGKQTGMHANFKLSASGEELYLLDSNATQVDKIIYYEQIQDLSYARNPNGTGNFVIQEATFNKSNDLVSATDKLDPPVLKLYPNPASQFLIVETTASGIHPLKLFSSYGILIQELKLDRVLEIDLQDVPGGIYLLKSGTQIQKFTKRD
ncbi:MAG: CotH kinase family protein [Saprospiraceae bacterium]|nr:CotH kinase family protein [Saprospiraceae bacterium]MBK7736975.1 CotH kinase family protein [Saprospiraceae bacterium]MBK7914431.1 CotH kinase family protein [Saprospiraceae bacterium]